MQTRALNPEELNGMSAERKWVNDLLAGAGSDLRLTATTADIPVLHVLLERGPFTEDAAGELELLGGIFGDVVAEVVGMSWIVIEDEDGTDFALQYGTQPIFVFPRSMILKRVEQGENAAEIDLNVMLDEIANAVREQLREFEV